LVWTLVAGRELLSPRRSTEDNGVCWAWVAARPGVVAPGRRERFCAVPRGAGRAARSLLPQSGVARRERTEHRAAHRGPDHPDARRRAESARRLASPGVFAQAPCARDEASCPAARSGLSRFQQALTSKHELRGALLAGRDAGAASAVTLKLRWADEVPPLGDFRVWPFASEAAGQRCVISTARLQGFCEARQGGQSIPPPRLQGVGAATV